MPIGEQPEVSDADKPTGQHMLHEAAKELDAVERHHFLGVGVRVIFPVERHGVIVDGRQAMVGDRHAVGVAGQVFEDLLGSAERRLGVHHPFRATQLVDPAGKPPRIDQFRLSTGENQASLLMKLLQRCQELPPEQPAQRPTGRKKPGRQDTHRWPSNDSPPPGTTQ